MAMFELAVAVSGVAPPVATHDVGGVAIFAALKRRRAVGGIGASTTQCGVAAQARVAERVG